MAGNKRPDRLGGTTRPRGRQEADLHVLDLDERSPDTEGVANLVTLVDEVAGLSTTPTEAPRFDRMLECLGVDR